MRRFFVAIVVVLLALTATAPVQPRGKKVEETSGLIPILANGTIAGHQPGRAIEKAAPAMASSAILCDQSPLAGSSFKTFGYYNPSSGRAVEGEVWTFDHLGGDPWEGWSIDDLTTDNFTAFQHIDATSWSVHNNVPPEPVITGAGSVWLGFHQDEADAACWEAGLGYGNSWAQQLVSPEFTNSVGDSVEITFDYWYDAEPGYDFIKVIVDDGVTPVTIATFTGQSGSYSAPLSFSQKVAVTGTFEIRFEFTSDGSYSDEDDLYSTFLGPFGVDEIDVVGLEGAVGFNPPYGFETDLEGWTAEPIPGVGSSAGLNDWAGYGLTGCGQSGNVISLHNGSNEHPAGQWERLTSPTVNISSYGTDSVQVWAEYDIYSNTLLADNVFWTWGFQHYPVICPVTGDSTWSDPAGPGLLFYSGAPQCNRFRSYANAPFFAPGVTRSGTTLVPVGSDSVRFYIEVVSQSGVDSGNTTPLFDNIEVGVSNTTTLIHVPSPEHPTIGDAVTSTTEGDTIVVRAGTYTGALNRDIDFDGTNRVLVSEDGRFATTIDCENLGRGLYFHSGETDSSLVDGFTFVRGTQQSVGALLYNIGASPTIRNCSFNSTQVTGSAYGVVRTDTGSPTFQCITLAFDTTVASGGALIVNGGNPTFESSVVAFNTTQFSTVSLVGGAPVFDDCAIAFNTATHAVIVSTGAILANSYITDNSGTGAYFFPAPPSIVSNTSFDANGSGGATLEDNSSTFAECTFRLNTGPGLAIRNVSFAASSDRSSGAPAVEATSTSPLFTDCRFSGNVNTSSNGGGILFDCTNTPTSAFTPTYINCIITGNSSLFNGGGVAVCGQAFLTDIAPVFQNCTISANNAFGKGGGVYMSVDNAGSEVYEGWVTMDRSIMWSNCADGLGSQAFMEGDNYLSFDCSDVDSTGFDGSGQIIYGGDQAYEDPEFCDGPECSGEGTIDGNFSIAVGSPADPNNSPCGQLIGASPVVCVLSAGGDGRSTPEKTSLAPNVPNPFNPTTVIRFDLADAGHVALEVYDVAGRLVRTLVDRPLPASRQAVTWDGVDNRGRAVASGVYFARLRAGRVVETRKMVLLK